MSPGPGQRRAFTRTTRADKADNARVSTGLIFKGCLESPSYKAKYPNVVREIATIFDAEKLDTLAQKCYEQIKSHAYEETRKELTSEEFDAAYRVLLKTIRTRTAAIRKDLGE